METIETAYIKDQFESLQTAAGDGALERLRKEGFRDFVKTGIPTTRNEEWRFTPIGKLFTRKYQLDLGADREAFITGQLEGMRLPGSQEANELVFVNGRFHPEFSKVRSPENELV